MNLQDGLPSFPKDNDKAKILILGTFPSEKSLECGEYYSNPKNQFWGMLEKVLGEMGLKNSSYKSKEGILRKYGITLCDCISKCERSGSADNNIIEKTAVGRNIAKKFFGKNRRNIEIIIINGVTVRNTEGKLGARGWFEKFNGDISDFESANNVKVVCLHSTSFGSKSSFNFSEWEENIKPYLPNKGENKKLKAFIVKKADKK